MRDIRFREWDQAREDMMPGHGMSYSVRKDSDDEVSFVFAHYESDESWKDNHRVLEQYTGIDDADGGPIYEGDILQDVNDGIIVGAVTYDDKEGMYECNKNCMYDVSDCKVVGNIHENPELLEAD